MTKETDDLSHWALARYLTKREAACLAVGCDPMAGHLHPDIESKVRLIAREIGAAADRALHHGLRIVRGLEAPINPPIPDIWAHSESLGLYLPSNTVRLNIAALLADPRDEALLRGVASQDDPEWHHDSFSHDDLAWWFTYHKVETAYDFRERCLRKAITESPLTDMIQQAWPWGHHETKLLRDLAAAAEKFWVMYDPTDKSTAPTNEQVTEWLVERNVPKRVAEVMAQILRVDGLPTGPRKQLFAPDNDDS